MISKKIKIISSIVMISLIAAPIFFRKKNIGMEAVDSVNKSGIKSSLFNIKSGNVVFFKFRFKNEGTLQNTPETHGISVIVSNLLFNRIDGLTPEETYAKLTKLGIYGLSVNAFADDFEVSFFTTKDKINDALAFLSLAFKNPTFSNGDLEDAKTRYPNIPNQDLSSPRDLMRDKLLSMLYTNDAYGMNNTGTAQVISGITSDHVMSFIRNRLHSRNLQVTIAGGVSKSELNTYINALFDGLLDNQEKRANRSLSPTLSENRVAVVNKPEMGNVAIVVSGIRLDDLSDVERAAAFVIADTIFHNDIGDFANGLRERGIANRVTTSVIRRSLSNAIVFVVYMEKDDVEDYNTYLEERFAHYSKNMKLQDFEKIRERLALLSNNGFTSLDDIDKYLESVRLPYNDITPEIFQKIASMFFSKSLRKTVVYMNETE